MKQVDIMVMFKYSKVQGRKFWYFTCPNTSAQEVINCLAGG